MKAVNDLILHILSAAEPNSDQEMLRNAVKEYKNGRG